MNPNTLLLIAFIVLILAVLVLLCVNALQRRLIVSLEHALERAASPSIPSTLSPSSQFQRDGFARVVSDGNRYKCQVYRTHRFLWKRWHTWNDLGDNWPCFHVFYYDHLEHAIAACHDFNRLASARHPWTAINDRIPESPQ